MNVKHAKSSGAADGADPTAVHPSDWNADHIVNITATDVGALPIVGGTVSGQLAISDTRIPTAAFPNPGNVWGPADYDSLYLSRTNANGNTKSPSIRMQHSHATGWPAVASISMYNVLEGQSDLLFSLGRQGDWNNTRTVMKLCGAYTVGNLAGGVLIGTDLGIASVPTSKLHVVGLATYANNAAAIAAGHTAGAFYAISGTDPRQLAVVF